MALLTKLLKLFSLSKSSSQRSKVGSTKAAELQLTCDETAGKTTVLKRRTAKHDTDSRPSEEAVKLDGYDPELTAMQTCIDDKSARVAHESARRKEAQEDLTKTLDEFLHQTKSA